MQDIAQVIGIKKASLYYHFPSKEALILEVLEYSFKKYLSFIEHVTSKWNLENFVELLGKFLKFPKEQKNLFSIINQNGYCDSEAIQSFVEQKQRIIFDIIHATLHQKANFTKEKTFLCLTLLNQIGKTNIAYRLCDIDFSKIKYEIRSLFFNI